MSRPTDWYVLDLPGDPVPGDPPTVSDVARTWSSVADDADTARTQISSLLGDQAVMQWLGKAGDAFRSHSNKLPDQLQKCADSYHDAASALSTWSTQLDGHQSAADHALVLGRAALADLQSAQQQLSSAQGNESSAIGTVNGLNATTRQAAHDTTVPKPDPAQVRAAVNRAAAAQQSVTTAQHAVGDAQARLNAAKRMAADAASLRDHDGHTTATKLHAAADAGIPPDSFWHKLGDALGKAWHVLVEIAKVVVVIGGIIALIIGGPIAWIVFAAALIVLADTLAKYAQGKASLLDVALSALSCIPCTKGLTSLAELSDAFKAGGLLGAGSHLLGSGKNAAIGFLRTAQRLRVGLVPGTTAVFADLGEAGATAAKADGLERLTLFYRELNLKRGQAVEKAWSRLLDDVGRRDPASAAGRWQGHASYPGLDPRWERSLGKDGSVVEAAVPGLGNFVVPEGTFEATGFDAARYSQGVQVGPTDSTAPGMFPYRRGMVRLRLNGDLPMATSTATANPQYGPGGLVQHYIPDVHGLVAGRRLQVVDAAGNPVDLPLGADGRPFYRFPSGAETDLTNYAVMPTLPSLRQIAVTRPTIHQTVSRAVGTIGTAGNLGGEQR